MIQFGNKYHKVDTSKNKGDDDKHTKNLAKTGHWGKRAAGCIFLSKKTGKICLNLRSKKILEPLTWGTWGGAIDDDENPKDAVYREATEEIGKNIKMELIPLYVFEKTDFKYYNFLALVDNEFTPKLDWESADYKWCTLEDLPSPLHPGLKILLQDRKSVNIIKDNIKKIVNEDAPVNAAGSGAVAGIGVGQNGEPGSPPGAIIRRSKFAGHEVFEVNGDVFHKSRMGKVKQHRYEKYVGGDPVGEEIRQYGRKNPGKPIVLKHEKTGALQFLKYGKY